MINQVDVFVFLDDAQFTRQDWRTKNKIKSNNGDIWLSVPIKKAPLGTTISKIEISQEQRDFNWQEKHYKTIMFNYKKAPYFNNYLHLLEEIYLKRKWMNLSEFNIYTIKLIAKSLGIRTEFVNSCELAIDACKDDKLIKICQKIGSDFYLSGPAAKTYITKQKFIDARIQLAYIDYNGYLEYKQLYGVFDHYVSVLDVLFNCGPQSGKHIFLGKHEPGI